MPQMQRKIKDLGAEYTVDFELDDWNEVNCMKVKPEVQLGTALAIKKKLQELVYQEKTKSYNESVEHEAWLRTEHS